MIDSFIDMARMGHLLIFPCLIFLYINLSAAVRDKSQCVPKIVIKTEKFRDPVKHFLLRPNGTLENRVVSEPYEIITVNC